MTTDEAQDKKPIVSERDFYDLVDNTPICIKAFDKDGKLIFVNKGGRDEHSIKDTDDISKWDWLGTVKEPYRAAAWEKFEKALKGEPSTVEFEHTPEGSKHAWCSGTLSPIKDENGNVKSVLFYSIDVSSLKVAELAAQEREQMFQTLLDSVPLCIKWFDAKGNLISVNKGGRKEHFLENLSEEEITNWDYMGCIDEAYHLQVKESMAAALKGVGSSFNIKHPPGTSEGMWCQSTMTPVKGYDGNIKYVLFLSRDITDEKLIEEERQKSEAEMKQKNEELEIFNKMTVNRELKMVELKEKIKELEEKSHP